MNRSIIWQKEHPERNGEIQRASSQKYYYKNREKVLAKKQQKYAEARGDIVVKLEDVPVPVPVPDVPVPEVPVPVIEVPKWIHPLFSK